MKFHIRTYGCQMNVRDTEAVGALLIRHGHELVKDEGDARMILVNTCSVRGKAEAKALGKLGLLAAGKRKSPDRIVGVMGCMAQRLKADVFTKVPHLDFAVGTHSLSRLPALLDLVVSGHGPVIDVGESDEDFDDLIGHADGKLSAFVNILLGCNRRCTYCIVPTVRGNEWSRPGADILKEVSALVATGVKEVTLLGQSVMSYGQANEVWGGDAPVSPRGYTEPLSRLLEAVAAIEGICRVRFTSGHPSGCTEELAAAMAEVPEVCEHLHLPLQSGSDRVLGRMRRGYTAADYEASVGRLRRRCPSLSLTTDIIVGFPLESEQDFEMTREFCKKIGFDNAFIFKYSPRPGTPAADWEDDVPLDVKAERNRLLLEDQNSRCRARHRQMVGGVHEVLVEGTSLRNADRWTGRTRCNRIVVFEPVPGLKVGDVVDIRIERAMAQSVYGKIIGGGLRDA